MKKECKYSKRLKEIQNAIEGYDKIKELTEPLLLISLQRTIEERLVEIKK